MAVNENVYTKSIALNEYLSYCKFSDIKYTLNKVIDISPAYAKPPEKTFYILSDTSEGKYYFKNLTLLTEPNSLSIGGLLYGYSSSYSSLPIINDVGGVVTKFKYNHILLSPTFHINDTNLTLSELKTHTFTDPTARLSVNLNIRVSTTPKIISCGITGINTQYAYNSNGTIYYGLGFGRYAGSPTNLTPHYGAYSIIINGTSQTNNNMLYDTTLSYENIVNMIAKIGLPFALTSDPTPENIVNNPDVMIPETDDTGTPTGNANSADSEAGKNDPKMSDDYDPTGVVSATQTPEEDPTKTVTGDIDPPADDTNKLPTINLFNRTFALTASEVKTLADELWNADETKFDEITKGLALMGGNPIQGLIDLRLYPIDFTQWTGKSEKIVVGRTTLDASGRRIETSTIPQFTANLGTISGQYKNFMDFEPFSVFQIYLPFVGTNDLPANLVIGHEISCKASVDIITGAISYIVKADGYPILYKNGTIGVSIPMTSDNAAEYAGNVIHATNNVVQTTAGAAKTVTNDVAQATSVKGAITDPSSNVAGAVNTGIDVVAGASAIATAGYDLSTTLNSTTIQQSGTSSPSNSLYTSMNVYILQEYHNPVIPANYAHDIGRACRKSGTVSSFSGYTIFSNVDLSGIPCTESEKTIILQTLQNGVYL